LEECHLCADLKRHHHQTSFLPPFNRLAQQREEKWWEEGGGAVWSEDFQHYRHFCADLKKSTTNQQVKPNEQKTMRRKTPQ